MAGQENLEEFRLDQLEAVVVDITRRADAGPAQVNTGCDADIGGGVAGIIVGDARFILFQTVGDEEIEAVGIGVGLSRPELDAPNLDLEDGDKQELDLELGETVELPFGDKEALDRSEQAAGLDEVGNLPEVELALARINKAEGGLQGGPQRDLDLREDIPHGDAAVNGSSKGQLGRNIVPDGDIEPSEEVADLAILLQVGHDSRAVVAKLQLGRETDGKSKADLNRGRRIYDDRRAEIDAKADFRKRVGEEIDRLPHDQLDQVLRLEEEEMELAAGGFINRFPIRLQLGENTGGGSAKGRELVIDGRGGAKEIVAIEERAGLRIQLPQIHAGEIVAAEADGQVAVAPRHLSGLETA